jgi:16S rRNA G966 N2-methylase RsmD
MLMIRAAALMTLRLSGGRKPQRTARPRASRVRQAVMNLLTGEIPGCRWLDLCCGSGAMACEALQRGAAEVARANLEAVLRGRPGAPEGTPPRARVDCDEVLRWLGRASASGFDLIYADPP